MTSASYTTADVQASLRPLTSLLSILTTQIQTLQSSFTSANLLFPDLNAPYQAPEKRGDESSKKALNAEEFLAKDETVRKAAQRIIAACEQLICTVRPPIETVYDAASFHIVSTSFSVLESGHITEILEEAGPDGLHVTEIVRRMHSDMNPVVLSRILRVLATYHIMREVRPNAFATNRVTSFFSTKKKINDILKDPDAKYDNTNGVSAFIGVCTQDFFKASVYIPDSFGLSLHPYTYTGAVESGDPYKLPKTAFNLAFNTPLPYFAYLESTQSPSNRPSIGTIAEGSQKEGTALLRRFAIGMHGGQHIQMDSVSTGFDWASLFAPSSPAGDRFYTVDSSAYDTESDEDSVTVVDVGGGSGSCCRALLRSFPKYVREKAGSGMGKKSWRFVVQDRPGVVTAAKAVWEKEGLGELVSRGDVSLVAHDFLKPQPRLPSSVLGSTKKKIPSIYLLRAVLHNWSDADARIILSHLRRASSSSTLLVLGEFLVAHACVDDSDFTDIEGGFRSFLDNNENDESARILLPNLGRASASAYQIDLFMQSVFESQERTLGNIIELTRSAGWEVVKLNRVGRSLFGYYICKPIEDWEK